MKLYENYDENECYYELSQAIVLQAVEDYKKALRKEDVEDLRMLRDCERFFNSQWFVSLTDLDGKRILTKLKEEFDK